MAPKESDPLDTPTILSEYDDYYGGVTPDDESIVSLLLMKPWNDEDSMIHDRTDSDTRKERGTGDGAAPASPVPPVILTEKDFYDALPPLNQTQDEIEELAAAALQSPGKNPNCRFLNFRGSRIIVQEPSPTPAEIDDALFQDVCIDLEKEVSYESMPSLYYDDFGGFAATTGATPKPSGSHSTPPSAPTIARKASSTKPSASSSSTNGPSSAASLQQKKRLRQTVNREFPLPSIRIDNEVMKHLAGKLDQLKSELVDVRWKMKQEEQAAAAAKQTKAPAGSRKRRQPASAASQSSSVGAKNSKRKRLVEVDGMKVFV
eukprot:CAMPEP_0194036980 /NCGR_PEP_ID=MMETSP0009_2-20130614/9359_1 /TAXON_ID=210454 /ORGANISM="Grammatophora oceanica, Strain CCMP 410" /LENGTH=317 /DNA_ID=CAMNT_0038678965 /DNA_START=36 /DNA_END=989 /DNA_ORIENTATION=+